MNVVQNYSSEPILQPLLKEETGEVVIGVDRKTIVAVELGGGWNETQLNYLFYSYGTDGFINLRKMSGCPSGMVTTMSKSNYSLPSPKFPNPYASNTTRTVDFSGLRLNRRQMFALSCAAVGWSTKTNAENFGVFGIIEPLEPYDRNDLNNFAIDNSTNISNILSEGFTNCIIKPSITNYNPYIAYQNGWGFVGEYAQSWINAFPSSIYQDGTSSTGTKFLRNVHLG